MIETDATVDILWTIDGDVVEGAIFIPPTNGSIAGTLGLVPSPAEDGILPHEKRKNYTIDSVMRTPKTNAIAGNAATVEVGAEKDDEKKIEADDQVVDEETKKPLDDETDDRATTVMMRDTKAIKPEKHQDDEVPWKIIAEATRPRRRNLPLPMPSDPKRRHRQTPKCPHRYHQPLPRL